MIKIPAIGIYLVGNYNTFIPVFNYLIYVFYSFYEKDQPEWYKNKEPKPHPGLDNGLRLVLDAHSDQISHGTVFDDFKGFVAVVDNRKNFPLTKTKSFLLEPGAENYVSISAMNIKSDEAIRKIDSQKRFCYFYDEHPLDLYKNYTQANCILECTINYGRQLMESNCTPWYFPGILLFY